MKPYQAHRFAIAPMMDWTESVVGSTTCERTCAKFAHVRSPFLSLSFVSGSSTAVSCGAIGRARFRVSLFGGPIYASVPLHHRCGSLASTVTLLIVAYADF